MDNEKTEQQTEEIGRTPGSAEGDRETVEADLEDKNLSEDNSETDKTANNSSSD
ncbi:MAG: hypothetical protein H7Z37_14165 [Pyrinomonadaceae bacterium]|nr:hypothetical protein [Pyrinomonadaceae bacterium]